MAWPRSLAAPPWPGRAARLRPVHPATAAATAAAELGLHVIVERLAALRMGRKEDAEVRRDN